MAKKENKIDKNTKIIIESVVNYISQYGKNVKIIDLGCGRGYILSELLKKGYNNIYGVDVKDQREFKNFQFLSNIDFCKENWSQIIIEKFGKFDIAIATEVIEHLTNPFLFLKETKNLLENDSKLILTFPNVHNLKSKILYVFEDRFSNFFGRNFNLNLHPIHDQHIFIPNIHLIK